MHRRCRGARYREIPRVLAAADVFTPSTTFWVMESIASTSATPPTFTHKTRIPQKEEAAMRDPNPLPPVNCLSALMKEASK